MHIVMNAGSLYQKLGNCNPRDPPGGTAEREREKEKERESATREQGLVALGTGILSKDVS